MSIVFVIRAAVAFVGIAVVGVLDRVQQRTGWRLRSALLTLIAVGAAAFVAFALWILWLHLTFPFQLEAMELCLLEHAKRLAAGQAVYPEPSGEFIAVAYNPGLYVILQPLLWLLPPSLSVLRIPSVLSTAALILGFGWVAARAAGDWRWGTIGACLPFLAFKSFDGSLATGHADAVMIVLALLGAQRLGSATRAPGRWDQTAAALLFAAAFWVKQPGGVLAIGAAAYLVWRVGRAAWWPLALLALLGPIAYVGVGPAVFGPDFIHSTYTLPASWANWSLPPMARYAALIVRWWAVPFGFAVVAFLQRWRSGHLRGDPLLFLLPFALLTGVLGAADEASNDNVFATAALWCLLVFVREAASSFSAAGSERARRWSVAGLIVCSAYLMHDFRHWIPAADAKRARAELDTLLTSLDGPLYAPWMGDPPVPVPTSAHAHWVPLEDRVRGTGVPTGKNPWLARMLEPVTSAPSPAYLIIPYPLEDDRLLAWLTDSYELQVDFGDRFEPLRGLPHRYGVGPPRYLYRRRTKDN